MDHFEMVEKLRTKANVSYEEAKAALEKTDWDVLDALVLLENEGKVKDAEPAREYTTQDKEEKKFYVDIKPEVKDGFGRLWAWIKDMIRKGNNNQFVITRKGEELIAFPITVLVLLVLIPGVGLPTILAAMIVGLFLGARYSFRGPNINNRVNDVMDKAQAKAASAVEFHGDKKEVRVDDADGRVE